jgi:hypothetical protein
MQGKIHNEERLAEDEIARRTSDPRSRQRGFSENDQTKEGEFDGTLSGHRCVPGRGPLGCKSLSPSDLHRPSVSHAVGL